MFKCPKCPKSSLEVLVILIDLKKKKIPGISKRTLVCDVFMLHSLFLTTLCKVTATGLEPRTTYFVNEHSTIQATIEFGFTLKRARDMTRT